jgi:TM2 domain-containing membrane protein YozV
MGTDLYAMSPGYHPAYSPIRSDRSRALAGILQLLIPGVGRIYLGYAAYGVLQLFFTLCFGIGYLWSIIDGIVILTGGVKLDGYGRQLAD